MGSLLSEVGHHGSNSHFHTVGPGWYPAWGGGPTAHKVSVGNLLKALEDAKITGKGQLVRELRDKLYEKREELGDARFKGILNELIGANETSNAPRASHGFLSEQLREWFSESGVAPGGGGSHGRSGGVSGGYGNNSSVFGGGPRDSGGGPRNSGGPLFSGADLGDYRPDLSLDNPGKKPKDVFAGFSQGAQGNCGTVSAIKASMMHFGQRATDVFKEVKEVGDGYDVTMRDGYKLHLTKDELKQAAIAANFKGNDKELMKEAIFMFAVSAKRAQEEGNDGKRGMTYAQALASLNDGEWSKEAFDRLGLKNHVRQVSLDDLAKGVVGTADTSLHSVAVVHGRKELWGKVGGRPTKGIAFGFI